MRNHVRIVGWLYIVICGLLLAAGLMFFVLLGLDKSSSGQKAFQMLAPPLGFVLCFGLLPGVAGGIGLLCSQRWARTILIILSAFLLLLLPIGTVWGGYSIWVLWSMEAQANSADGSRFAVPASMPSPSPLFRLLWIMACVAAGFFLVLKVGFILHDDPMPAPFESPVLTAASVLVLLMGAVMTTFSLVRSLGETASMARIGREMRASAARHQEIRHQRAAVLAADPSRAKYAPLVEQGEDWSDENIAYDQNREMTVTCEHLQPIERAMRQTGLYVRRHQERDVKVQCQIDFPALQQRFGAVPPVRYAEFYQGDRSPRDFPTAFLICDAHSSMIHILHPDECREETPIFPTER